MRATGVCFARQSACLEPVLSFPVGPIPGDVPPSALDVFITGQPIDGQQLTGQYTYFDPEGDVESGSTYRWLRDGVPIPGATGITYTESSGDDEKLISFEVTPGAATGASPGVPVVSAPVGRP